MSTIAATNLKNPSSGSNNIVLATGGDTTITNNLTVSGTGSNSIAGTFQFNSGYGSAATAYGCRAWVNFNGTTATPSTIRGSGNVTSVTKNATGVYTINFLTAMVDANYSTLVSSTYLNYVQDTTNYLTGSVRINTTNYSGSLLDVPIVTASIFR
jgi:hypothetical protein